MKILLTNNHLDRFGGSETFTYTMAKELESRGHTVDVFTFHEGVMSEKLNCVEPTEYDLILINHNSCLKAVKDIKGFKIFTSHGIFEGLEEPFEGADRYVAINEEVAGHHDFIMKIIRNGIDCERYKPVVPLNDEPKRLLCLSHGKQAQDNVKRACEEIGIEFMLLDRDTFNVEDYINRADIVVSLGRGVYEAMACGREVIVYDNREYADNYADGIVRSGNIDEIVKNNCSGRRYKLDWGVSDIINAIAKYNPNHGLFNREYALKHFDIKQQVDKYLELYESSNHKG